MGIEPAIDRLVAQHPNTDEVTLDHLGSSKDKTTRKYVAAHPGTPHDVLFKLASQFPEQFFNNPVLDLILLENPQLLDAIPPRVLSSLVKREYCPVSFLEAAAESKNESVIRALLMNPQTPHSAILKVLKQYHIPWNVRAEAEEHINSWVVDRGDWYAEFQKHVLEEHWYPGGNINELRLFLSGSYPSWLKPAMVRNLPGEVVEGIAGNTAITWDILELLFSHENEDGGIHSTFYQYTGWDVDHISNRIASNPATPIKFLEEMLREFPGDGFLISSIACNPNLPIKTFENIVKGAESYHLLQDIR